MTPENVVPLYSEMQKNKKVLKLRTLAVSKK
jgi:hypothetical protein